jgi:DNA-binding GntR family transcriptional regulator
MTEHPAPQSDPPTLKLRDKAYASFTQHLLSRDIRPGQFISQRELVELTGLPLGAIRELIPRLEAEGLITTVPQRGMQVAYVDLDLIRNAFQFRLILEREAVRAFAISASDAEIAALIRAHETIIARARAGDTATLVSDASETDRLLHETLIDHLGNAIISQAYRVNWLKIRLIRQNETRLFEELVIPVMEDHLAVLDALRRRDADGAVEAMTRHIGNARHRATGL